MKIRDRSAAGIKQKKQRRQSEQAMKDANAAVQVLVKRLRAEFKGEEKGKLEELITDLFSGNEEGVPLQAHKFWETINKNQRKFSVRKANDRYLRAIVETYAVYDYVVKSPLLALHIQEIGNKAGVPPTSKKWDLLRLVAKLVVDYSVIVEGKTKTHHKSLSRDTLAIRYLMSMGVPPYEVIEYQSANGGGVDEWSRMAATIKNLKPGSEAKAVYAALTDKGSRPMRWKHNPCPIEKKIKEHVLGSCTCIKPEWCAANHLAETYQLEGDEVLVFALVSSPQVTPGVSFLEVRKGVVKGPSGIRRARMQKFFASLEGFAVVDPKDENDDGDT